MTYALEHDDEVLGVSGGPLWRDMGLEVYDAPRIEADMTRAFRPAMDGVDLVPSITFIESPTGALIVSLEHSARQAISAPSVEEATIEAWRAHSNGPHADAIAEFVALNDLIEADVEGAMNSNYAFLSALSRAVLEVEPRGDPQILLDLRQGEDEIRDDTADWLSAFLPMA